MALVLVKAEDLRVGDSGTIKRHHWKYPQYYKVKEITDKNVIVDKSFSGSFGIDTKEYRFSFSVAKESMSLTLESSGSESRQLLEMFGEFKFEPSGKGYILLRDYCYRGLVKPKFQINHKYFTIYTDGVVHIKIDYWWDGATGIPDCKHNLRGSCVHDVYCQAMGLKLLPMRGYRNASDLTFSVICEEDGLNPFMALIYYHSLRVYGKFRYGY